MFGKKSPVLFITLASVFLFYSVALAASVGFVSSTGIFFSKEKFFAGEQVKVYSVVVNNTYTRLTAVVAFLDNGTEFGRATADVALEQAQQINVSWVPTQANHTVVAKFISAVGYDSSGSAKTLNENEINTIAPPISKQITVDGDIDHDTLGDHDEPVYSTSPLIADTDGDGLTDGAEVYIYHTNPTLADTDGDGMNDGDEIKVGRNPLVPDSPPPPPPPPPSVPALPTVIAPQTQNHQAPASQPSATTKSQTVSVPTKTTPKESATKPEVVPYATSTPTISETEITTSTPAPTPAAAKTENKKTPFMNPAETNWVKVLGIIASLLAVAAGTSGFLAWRERNKY